jgi:Domain of unknown function (DUF3303)
MKYLTMWTIRPENLEAAAKRFREGDPKIPGVKATRFHELGTGRGVTLVECDDPTAVTKYALAWADLVEQRIVPVVGDAEVAAALK